MKQAGPEFLTDVESNQQKATETREFLTQPTINNHLNRVRVSVTTPEHSLHRYTLTSELRARLWSFPWRVSLPCSDRKYQVSWISNSTNHHEDRAQPWSWSSFLCWISGNGHHKIPKKSKAKCPHLSGKWWQQTVPHPSVTFIWDIWERSPLLNIGPRVLERAAI